jgi:hypothetical protein
MSSEPFTRTAIDADELSSLGGGKGVKATKIRLFIFAVVGLVLLPGCTGPGTGAPREASSAAPTDMAASQTPASLTLADTCSQLAGTRRQPGVLYRTHDFMVKLATPGSPLDMSEVRPLRSELQELAPKADPTLRANIEGIRDPLDQITAAVESHGAGSVTTQNDRYNESWMRLSLACPQPNK